MISSIDISLSSHIHMCSQSSVKIFPHLIHLSVSILFVFLLNKVLYVGNSLSKFLILYERSIVSLSPHCLCENLTLLLINSRLAIVTRHFL
ncbi:hypothetical protein GLOIN_2v1718699 [Rhizophagus irregularis DAOM 181602=DAOM 197198]|nr:hypothetical protein GLOIN_2v1718699 [Rhizophagus irregularis DAOM 181602=DAOM 197198]